MTDAKTAPSDLGFKLLLLGIFCALSMAGCLAMTSGGAPAINDDWAVDVKVDARGFPTRVFIATAPDDNQTSWVMTLGRAVDGRPFIIVERE
jgi:hypothetical protein